MKNKRIFLLGATGQIGKELAYEFKKINTIEIICHSRTAVKSSFFNFQNIKNVVGELNDEKIVSEIKSADLIFELAAPDSGTLKEIKEFYKKRIDIVIPNMKKGSKFVFASTMNAFGIDSRRKKLKNYIIPSSIYASNKRFAESYLNKIGVSNEVETYSLRLGEVHGKFQRASLNILKLIKNNRVFEIPTTPAWITSISLIKDAIVNIISDKEKPGLYTLVCDNISWTELFSTLGSKINIKPKYKIITSQKKSKKIKNIFYKTLSYYKDFFRGNFEISKDYEDLLKLQYRINKLQNSINMNNKLKIYDEYNRYIGILPGKRFLSLKYNKDEVLKNLIT